MNVKKLVMMCLTLVLPLAALAQGTLVDGHYVDPKQGREANPTSKPDYSLTRGVTVKKTAPGKRNAPIAPATDNGLPDHVNNGANKYFRSPVANQSGNSCGITSRHSHMMAYELNAYRDKDGSLAENMLPAHFAFVPAYGNHPSKEDYAKYVGVPDGVTFGGTNTSTIYGGPFSEYSNNYGRMQGYENWHKAMFNRITDNPNFPTYTLTEAGALAWKRWLYNHNGDESFHAGGVIGIGVASSGMDKAQIESTTANDAAGVTGKYYLTHWGTGVDHAMVIVGYDDRIEFDLDGDGTYGSSSNHFGQNEMGAWIVCNSWGSSWHNGGFSYVPYALASPTSTSYSSGGYSGYKAGDANGWDGEIYKIRKDYTPIRTLKAAVAYSKRSEIQIRVGISTNLNATSPDKTLVLVNHDYRGDYDGNNTDAEVPMLGQWSDGQLHTEAMEFGYDLTDFTDEFDRHVPLKYFLIINTKSGASGTGKIEYASIMDYELNANGVETPFASKNVNITNNGGTTTISTIVYGEEVYGPDNLTLSGTTLSWDAPAGSSYTPSEYYVYQDDVRIATTTTRSYNIGTATGVFHVTASLYSSNGAISESPASNKVLSGMSSSSFITYIGDPITSTSDLTSGSYVVLKCYGQGKYVFDNSSAYLLTSTAPEILTTDDYKYVFKVTKSVSTYTFQSVNGYLPALNGAAAPSNSAGSYTVASQGNNLFTLKNGSNYLNGTASSTLTGYGALDNNDKYYIYPVHVSVPGTNTLSVTIADPGTVYANVPVQLSLEGAADIASATWTVAGTQYTGVSPVVTFSGTGSKSVSCTATDSKGNSKTVSRSISVSAAPTATADFTLSSESTTGSDRISFISQNTVPGCTYNWSMPGAEVETATTHNASATYLSSGQKTVTLTVTDPNNNVYTHSETFEVIASSPNSRYSISPAIVVKNNPVTLTDNSLYNPTSWSWRFDSDNNRITCNTQNGTITPTKAGVYKLTFGTGNEAGSDFVEAERALIVCNSESENGLTLAGGNQSVTATMSSSVGTAWTIDFWSNPKSLSATGITGSNTVYYNTRSFTITSNANGVATLSVNSKSVSTDAAFYIANEWHHYAITFAKNGSNGTVTFYRDGSVVSAKTLSSVSDFSNYFKSLQLGGSSTPMDGSIDEFRIWNTTLSQTDIRSYCVAPIIASTSGLQLYWQMNQSEGTTVNAAKGVTGTLNNFNNAGDAWSDSDGVFALDFSDASNPTISANQLSHVYDNVYSVSDEQDGSTDRSSLEQAFDGDASTYYQSQWTSTGGNGWLEISYPHAFTLRRGALHEVTAFDIVATSTPYNTVNQPSSASYGRAKYVTIEESDDATNWNYVDKDVRLFDMATNNVILPWPITKEYVRFTFSEPIINDGSYVALLINEMNFYGTSVEPTKTEVPLTYVSCSDESSRSDDKHLGEDALDGSESTFWHSYWESGNDTPYPHSITVQNANQSDIDMFYFYQQHSSTDNQNGNFRAGVMNVETSSNGSTWSTAFTGLRIPYGNTGYVKLPESINARYIKLTFTRNQKSTGNGTFLAMNEIKAYGVEESVTVTWNLLDPDGIQRYTVNKTYNAGNAITAYPEELTAWEDKYVQLEALSNFTPTTDMTKTVHCTYNMPFTVSDASTTYYYKLGFFDYWTWYDGDNNCLINYLSSATSSDALTMVKNADASDTKYQWAFYGNPFDGFSIKNRNTGKTLYDNNALEAQGIPVLSESNATLWTILPGTYPGNHTNKNGSSEGLAEAFANTITISENSWFFMNYGFTNTLKFASDAQADRLSNIKATLVETVNLTNTITWNVVDENATVLCTVDKTYTTGTQVTAYPTELTDWVAQYADYFVALPALTSFTVTADGEKNVPYEWTGPFEFSTDTEKHLYHINNTYYGYLYAPQNVNERVFCNSSLVNTSGRWAWMFKGNPFDGIQIISYYDESTGLAAGFDSEYGKRKATPTTYFIMQGSASGNIVISNAFGSNDVLVSYPYDGDGTNAIYHNAGSGKSQWNGQFTLSEIDESIIILPGYYKIHNASTGNDNWGGSYESIYLTVNEASSVLGINRYDYSSNRSFTGNDYEKTAFRFEEQNDGTFIISKNGYYLSGGNAVSTTAGSARNCEVAATTNGEGITCFTIKVTDDATNERCYLNIDTWSASVSAWSIDSDRPKWLIEPVEITARTADQTHTVNSVYYATAYLPFDYTLPEGVKAYTITVNGSTAEAHELTGGVPAGTGVLLVGNGTGNLKLCFDGYSAPSSISNNLTGTYEDISTPSGGAYVFSAVNNVPGFYRYSGNTLGAYKAYIPIGAGSKDISGFTIVFDENGEVTGIDPIYDLTNDNLTIDNTDGPLFNLQGQRVNTPKRGIYVINGKKIVVK